MFKLIGVAFLLHILVFIGAAQTGCLELIIDGGDWDFTLDKLENIIIGLLMLVIRVFALVIILRMAERKRSWILTGMGFLCYGIDRTVMDLGRSFVEDKIIIPYMDIKIGVSLLGLNATSKKASPPNMVYWFFEFGDHYWTCLTILLAVGQQCSTLNLQPTMLLVIAIHER